eukprot:TRINITY_DN54887_c0_g1_i1.p1 TRINITY_DN54887_c0_g1~~TRINITY_DN54887_c0_g1_i1.p1  ORF type:complete len:219 (+),score=63.87 TRINITY_DN54887_c0_g1_i1:65-721(+)
MAKATPIKTGGYAAAGGDADDFEDIVDSPFAAGEPRELLTADGNEEEEFEITGDTGSKADAVFDRQVEVLQETVLDDSFQVMLDNFLKEHCQQFEATDENKLCYTDIFNRYQALIEGHLEKTMAKAIPGFSMEAFLAELEQRGEDEIDSAVLDLLLSLADFSSFKEQMLAAKDASSGMAGLSIAGKASKIHVDDDEDGELRPDLGDLLTVTPASPKKG